MYTVKTKEVGYARAIELIDETLAEKGLTCKDLVKLIRYPLERKGLDELNLYLSGGYCESDEMKIREKIGMVLQMDRLRLLGEHSFDTEEEAARFVFRPYLVRVPEKTSPSSGSAILAFVGLKKIMVPKVYDELLGKTLEEQLKYIKDDVLNDNRCPGKVPFFGKKLGYAYYWDFDQPAVPLSVTGEVLEDMVVTYGPACSCSVQVKAKELCNSGWFHIPRLTPKSVVEAQQSPTDESASASDT